MAWRLYLCRAQTLALDLQSATAGDSGSGRQFVSWGLEAIVPLTSRSLQIRGLGKPFQDGPTTSCRGTSSAPRVGTLNGLVEDDQLGIGRPRSESDCRPIDTGGRVDQLGVLYLGGEGVKYEWSERQRGDIQWSRILEGRKSGANNLPRCEGAADLRLRWD